MAIGDNATASRFRSDLELAYGTIQRATTATRTSTSSRSWDIWITFCNEHRVDPYLEEVADPIPFFLVFAVRYRDGTISKSGRAVRSGSVDDVLRNIGQEMALLGKPDRRLVGPNKLDLRLSRLLLGFSKADPPPDRVQPVPTQVLAQLFVLDNNKPFDRAISDLSTLGFYFLCRPGEAIAPTDADSDAAPFRLCDVEFLINNTFYWGHHVPVNMLPLAEAVRLVYTTQKNSNRGDKVGLNRAGDPLICPVQAAARRVQHLRAANAPSTTPIYMVQQGQHRTLPIYARHVTAALRAAAATVRSVTGIDPDRLSARSLRPGGATALLCADVDHDKIKLLGRWKSDAMIRYLHVQAVPAMRTLAQRMLAAGNFTFQPSHQQPDQARLVLAQLQQQAPPG